MYIKKKKIIITTINKIANQLFTKPSKLLLILLFMCLISFSTFAKPTISISDTTIPRGDIYRIPVLCSLHEYPKIQNILVGFKFDKYLLSLKSVETNENTVLQDKSLLPPINYSSNPAYFSFSSSTINSHITDTLCFLKFEALVAPDSICDLAPANLSVNYTEISDAELISAKIKVVGESIIINSGEYLSLNYPNPFEYETSFDLTLQEKTGIEFKTFALDTRNLLGYKDVVSQIQIFKVDSGYNKDVSGLQELEKGKYLIKFRPSQWIFASGQYLFVLKTDKNTYSRRILFVK